MNIRIFQKGFNFSQDGRGNRLVYHLQGCNMRCLWCANPEGISLQPTLMADKAKLLPSACPYGAITGGLIDRSKCESCDSHACMSGGDFGVSFSGRDYAVDDIVKEAQKSKPMFFGGGGVTLTGGEPTLQFEGVRELFAKLKNLGIHTALETNGTHPKLPELFPLVDQLMMDFKHYDTAIHKQFTGVGNQTIKANILATKQADIPLFLRIPLVNGVNAGVQDAAGFAEFFKQANWPGLSVELLRYHEFGKDKWEKCGMKYTMHNGFVTEQTVDVFEKSLIAAGVRLVQT